MTIDKLAWIRLNNGRLLVARSHHRALYYIPGGKREAGETDAQALMREVQEELSVELLPGSLRFLGEFSAPADGKPADVLVRLRCYAADYLGELAPAAEIAEMAWLNYADRPRVSAVAQRVFDYLNHAGHLA